MVDFSKPKGGMGVIVLFVFLVTAYSFVSVLGNSVNDIQNAEDVFNESISITGGSGLTANGGKVTQLNFFGNGTNSTHVAGISIGTEVNFSNVGDTTNITVSQDPAKFGDGSYNISYTFEDAEFTSNSTSRTLLDVVIVMFIIFIAVIAGGFAMKQLNII